MVRVYLRYAAPSAYRYAIRPNETFHGTSLLAFARFAANTLAVYSRVYLRYAAPLAYAISRMRPRDVPRNVSTRYCPLRGQYARLHLLTVFLLPTIRSSKSMAMKMLE